MLAVGVELLEPACRKPFAALSPASVGLRLEAIEMVEIDAALVRLAVLEARTRLRLGRAASRFLELRGHDRIGFIRVGDYARERLGISGRELQSFAFVASRVRELPLLCSAFARGEISWSQARLLCGVATRETEAAWLEVARGAGVGELAESIRARSGAAAAELAGALDDVRDETDGEPRARLAIACPARLTVLWRSAVELARRMIGSQAPTWQAAEAIAAEAASSGMPVISGEAGPSGRIAQGKTAIEEALPRLARLAVDGTEDDPDDLDVDALDVFDLDLEMRFLVDELRTVDARLGRALRRSLDLRAFRARGFSSFDVYVRDRIGISPAKARALVALDRRAREASAFGEAYRSGRLSWARALAILPVARDEREQAWVERANEVMVRRLQDEVDWVLDQQDAHGRPATPPPHDSALEPVDLQTCARRDGEVPDHRVTFYGPAAVVGLFRGAVGAFTGPSEPRWLGLERLLRSVISEWESRPSHRDPIFARDRWRCSVPGCSSRRGLEDHHIEFRSRGGGNERENRTAICGPHHRHAVHRHLIRARGRAPDDVLWELGLRPGRAPLLVLRGERYVSSSVL